MVNISSLRENVTLQSASEMQDEFGNNILEYKDVKNQWAAIESLSYREITFYAKMDIEVTHKLKFRSDDLLFQIKRILWKNRKLSVQSVLYLEETKSYIEVVCKEVL